LYEYKYYLCFLSNYKTSLISINTKINTNFIISYAYFVTDSKIIKNSKLIKEINNEFLIKLV